MTLAVATLLLGINILGLGGDPEDAAPFPVEATGDIHFQLDAARFLEDSLLVQEIYLSIPQKELFAICIEEGDSLFQINVKLDFCDHDGNVILTRAGDLDLPYLPTEAGDGLSPAHTLTFRPEIPKSTNRLKVYVTDINAGRKGLLYQIRGLNKEGKAEAWFDSNILPHRGGMSDILHVWSVSDPEEGVSSVVDLSGSGRALRERILPNPSHFYGLYHQDLAVYGELYPDPDWDMTEAQLLLLVEALQDSTMIRQSRESIPLKGSVVPVYRRFDLSDFSGGTYALTMRWTDPADSMLLASKKTLFQVLWEPETWYLTEKELLEDAHVLLSDLQYREFVQLDRGNKELYMERFWKEHDPIPSTPQNEIRQVFEQRKAYAQRNFGGFRKGKLSDRGRLYIRWGSPDEIEKELSPSDREALNEVIYRELDEDDMENSARRGARVLDNRSFEVWYYHLQGEPLFPEYVSPRIPREMKYIFVDQLGIGEYTLVYTNVFGGID
ncbi:MAG: GWxTD domain-containing protein [Candidatus Eisenbacteria bacterium]|nr:GWxTD domain-containing protein [Candidatus Eisenbacteria bacterium]MBU1949762.1 GWxTD domain-containing protein [Candidatus Eisenbacteria bacterium]